MVDGLGMYVTTFLVAGLSTTLRGFQNRAVSANNKKVAMGVGIVMNACDLLVVATLVANMNFLTIMVSAQGAGFGWILGMHLHDVINRKRREQLAKEKNDALKKRIDKRLEKRLDKMFDDMASVLGHKDDTRIPVHMPDGTVMHMHESLYNAIKAKAAEERDAGATV